jgi:hypothetical protein
VPVAFQFKVRPVINRIRRAETLRGKRFLLERQKKVFSREERKQQRTSYIWIRTRKTEDLSASRRLGKN